MRSFCSVGCRPVGADQLLGHLRLLYVVHGAEGDVMHRTPSLAASQMSTTLPFTSPAAAADRRSFTGNLAEAEHVGQDRCRLLRAVEKQGHALEAADRMFGGNVPVAEARLILGIGNADERKCHPIWIRERQHGLSEALLKRLVVNSLLGDPKRHSTHDAAAG